MRFNPNNHRRPRNPELQPAMGFQEIADELNISRQRVHQLYESAMRKLRARKHDTAGAILADLEAQRTYARSGGATSLRNWARDVREADALCDGTRDNPVQEFCFGSAAAR